MKKQALMMVTVIGLVSSPLLAHGAAPHLKGTVSVIAADQITVKDADGHESQAKITPRTRFMRGKAAGKQEEIHQGDRVVVHTKRDGSTLEAAEIHYATPTK